MSLTCRIAISSIATVVGLTMGSASLGQQMPALAPFSGAAGSAPPAPWRVVGLPKSAKPLTRFDLAPMDGRPVLRVQADHSYANLVHDLPDIVPAPGMQLRWRWRLDQPLHGTDLRRREGDDVALKVCLLFDLPLENLGFMDRNMLRVARAASGERLPAATLCYVWDNTLPVGTLINNAYTSRLRLLVVSSGAAQLGQWVSHQRDIAADFQRAFGREGAAIAPLEAVLVGADADNTGGQSLGFVGDVTLVP
jgi:hypothetical protein